jgi:hypothetical protein
MQDCQIVYFQTKYTQIWEILEGLKMENVGTFYGHLEYNTDVWHILEPFDNLVAIWYIFPRFGILHQEKSGNPGSIPNNRLSFLQRL